MVSPPSAGSRDLGSAVYASETTRCDVLALLPAVASGAVATNKTSGRPVVPRRRAVRLLCERGVAASDACDATSWRSTSTPWATECLLRVRRDDLSYLDGGPCDYSANAASPRLTRATRRPGGLPRRPGRRSACYGYVETTCRTLTPLAVRRGPELGLYTVEATVGDVLHGVPSRTLKESRLVYPAQARKWFQTPKKR